MAELIKICPNCETKNAAIASFCIECDWDLINVPAQIEIEENGVEIQIEAAPEIEEIEQKNEFCVLESLENPQMRFQIGEGQTVGRGAQADVKLTGIPNLEWVSRVHARFFRRGEQWFIQYLAQGNFIKVDGEEFSDDSEIALHNGSLVSLSLTTFLFRE